MKWFVTLNKQMAHLIRPLGNDHFLYLLLLCGSLFGRQKWPLPQCDPEPPKLCSALWHIAGPRNMSVLCTRNTKLTLDFQKRYDTEPSSSWHLATISTCDFHLGPSVITASVAADHLITPLDLYSLFRMWEHRVMKWIYATKKGKHGIKVLVWRGGSQDKWSQHPDLGKLRLCLCLCLWSQHGNICLYTCHTIYPMHNKPHFSEEQQI